MIMRNEEKIRKQKNSLLWNHHKIGLGLLGVAAIVVPIHAFGASFSAVAGVYLGYRRKTSRMDIFKSQRTGSKEFINS